MPKLGPDSKGAFVQTLLALCKDPHFSQTVRSYSKPDEADCNHSVRSHTYGRSIGHDGIHIAVALSPSKCNAVVELAELPPWGFNAKDGLFESS